jgi:hypothetical protein
MVMVMRENLLGNFRSKKEKEKKVTTVSSTLNSYEKNFISADIFFHPVSVNDG